MIKRTLVILLLLVSAPGFVRAQAKAVEKPMSLEECILSALKNNPRVAADVLTPEIAAADARRAGEIFLPKLSLGLTKDSQNSASYSFIDAAEQIITKDSGTSLAYSQLLPTGGQLSARLSSYSQDTNRSFLTINPLYGSTLTFGLTQPLLRNFGFAVTRQQILVARNNFDTSESEFRGNLMDFITSVEEAYWTLVYNLQNLKVQQESLRLARDLLSKNQHELDAGMIPPIDLLSARAEVASREAEILDAEALVKNSQDTLRTLIRLPAEKGAPKPVIVPTDEPETASPPVNLDTAVEEALANRPDLEISRVDIRTKGLNLSVARNQLLPNLSLQASFWSPGISGTQIIYQDNDPLTGVIVDTIPGGRSAAFHDATSFKYKNWSVGLTLDVPFDTAFSRAQYARAKLDSERAALLFKDKEEQAVLEVEIAVRAVETDFKRVQAYRVARELAEEKLKAEVKKLAAGMSTNYTVLQQQRDLATAQSGEIKALTDYRLSRARLDRTMGLTLRRKNIDTTNLQGS
jgi:outer membrane protein TolC